MPKYNFPSDKLINPDDYGLESKRSEFMKYVIVSVFSIVVTVALMHFFVVSPLLNSCI